MAFGSQVIFSLAGVNSSVCSGSITSFQVQKQTEVKEITDGSDNFLYIAFPKKKKVASMTAILTSSGSATSIAEVGSTATITVPWSSDVSGSWGVTKASVKGSADSEVTGEFELTQWFTSTGTTLP